MPVLDLDRALLKQCVHCGLCLDACPTYRVLGLEMDSPRGRIFQVRRLLDGAIGPDDPHLREHLDLCLDCRACETACPSGVQYGRIVEGARTVIKPARPRERLIRRIVLDWVFPSNFLLDVVGGALRLYQVAGLQTLVRKSGLLRVLSQDLAEMEELLPPVEGGVLKPHVPEVTAPLGEKRCRVGLITGCVMSQLMGRTNRATVRVLAANGCEVVAPPDQVCCGALHSHLGERETARRLARRNIASFEKLGVDVIVVNAAGCGSTLKEYGHLLYGDPAWADRARDFSARVRDVSEFLADLGLATGPMGWVGATVTYQDPCHLVHAQRIRSQPRQLLKAIPGLELVEMKDSDVCCGSAGVYNLTHRAMSIRLLEEKMDNIAATGAGVVVTPNPGCAMQVSLGARRRGMSLEVVHVVDLLDRAYRAGGTYSALPSSLQQDRAIAPAAFP